MTALDVKSKIKFKGVVFIGLKAYVESRFEPVYWNELVEKSGFPTSKPLASSWFEGKLYPQMLEFISNDINQSFKQTVIDVAKFSVEHDLNGIYRFLMKVSGLTSALTKLPRLSNSYCTASPMSVALNEKGSYQIRIQTVEEYYDFVSWCAEGAIKAIIGQFKNELTEFEPISKDSEVINGQLISTGVFQASY